MRLIIFAAIAALFVTIANANTLRYSSGCSVDECELIDPTNNSSCSQPAPCYRFVTSRNATICAPQVLCSLFDACTSSRTCTSNTSVCVTNTCCVTSICVPLSLTSACSMYTTTSTPSWSGRICPNATWADNGTLYISNYINGSWVGLSDFILDRQNNLFAIDSSNYRILRFPSNSTSSFTVAVIYGNNSGSSYQAQNIFVDSNGSIYTTETMYVSSPPYATYYRVMKYVVGSSASSTVVYGPTTCGSALNELCYGNGFLVDASGSIYYSDAQNHRVLKIQQLASTATVAAGISGVSGSALNQLNNPAGIAMDSAGSLYVVDQNNYRVMKYSSGSSTGTQLFTMNSFQSGSGIAVDSSGSVYLGNYGGILRWVPGSGGYVTIASTVYWGVARIRMDSYGNIYTGGYSWTYIYKFNITSNYC